MALDVSSSLTLGRLEQLRSASAMLLDSLKPEDQAALLTFTEAIHRGSGLTTDLSRVRAALAATRPRDGTRPTSLADAVCSALVIAGSDVGRALVVVFSDGVDTTSWLQPDEVIDVARRSDAIVYPVATRHDGQTTFLADVAEATGGSLIEVQSTRDLGNAFVAVLDEFRQRYLISYTPRGVAKDGWHPVTVRVKGRGGLKVKARPGYWAGR
jgi:VWFA-related protein